MKKIIRIVSFVLVMIMFVSIFASCKKPDDTEAKDTDAAADGSDAVVSTDEGETTSKPIEVIDWGGREYRVLGRDSAHDFFDSWEVFREELPEDTVGVAVWDRNNAIKDKYGIVVKGYLVSSPESISKTMLDAGEDLYDLIICAPETFHPYAMNGYLLDLQQLNYINLEHDCWQDYANKQMTMGGRLYYTTNKFLLEDKHRSWMAYYNRELAAELNLGYFEDFVFDGSWTIEKVTELAKAASADKDGQPGMSQMDRWGMTSETYYSFCQLAFGCGFRLTQNGSDGYPELIGATSQIISTLDKVYDLISLHDVYYCDQMWNVYNESVESGKIFWRGDALIYEGCVSSLGGASEKATFNFGVLPNPKYNEEQKDYYSIPNLTYGSLFGVPATTMDTDFAGYALEALSEEALTTTYPAYMETKCKLQDVYDEDAAKCLEIIFDGVVYDVAFVSNIAGLGSLVWNVCGATVTNTYARNYDKYSKFAQKEINRIRETYAEFKN